MVAVIAASVFIGLSTQKKCANSSGLVIKVDALLKYFIPFIPIASLGMALQGILAIYFPEYELAQLFIADAPRIFFFEIIVMHSGIFWANRKDVFKKIWAQNIASVAILLFFGLGILPIAIQSPWLGFNYFALCMARLFTQEAEPWYAKTDFFKKGIKPSSRNSFIGVIAFVKVIYLGVLIPLIILLCSSASESYVELVKKSHPNESDISTTIILIKSVALYYCIYAVYELYTKLKSYSIKTLK